MSTSCFPQAGAPRSPYLYASLKEQCSDTIRLLRIQPDNSHTVNCTMLSVPLSEQPNFNALSYMWGNAEADTYIIIDGLKFLVRHNLLMFLKRYCQEGRSKPIWIVQEIVLARVAEVYYGRAASVSLANVLTWRRHTMEMINSMQFSDAVYQWRFTITDPQTPSNMIFNCKFPNREGDWFQAELRSRKTANMIAHFINTECTDPRDKVYAFLGMSRDQEDYGVVADYTRHAADLSLQVCDAQTRTWPGKRLAFAKGLQNALDCTFDILTGTETCRCSLEFGASNFVQALGPVDDNEQQDFTNTSRDEQSLHAVIVSSTYTKNLEDNDKLVYSISAREEGRQVVVLSRTHVRHGDLLFRLNGSHVYMKYRKNAANQHFPSRHQHLPAAGLDGKPQDGTTKRVSQSPSIRNLPAAAVKYRPTAHRRERVCCLQDTRVGAQLEAGVATYTGEEDEKTRSKRISETIETVEELFPGLTCEGSC